MSRELTSYGNCEQKLSTAKLGVVVPTLNSSRTLDWTLCALLNLRDVCVSVLVADSGSNDGTLAICKRWNVPTIYVPPGNMYRAINAGLRMLETEWLTYLNSDDLVYPDGYSRLLALGENKRADVVYGKCDFVDREGRFLYQITFPPPSRLKGMYRCGRVGFNQTAAVFRRHVFRELDGFNETYRLISDYEFFLRAHEGGFVHAQADGPSVGAFRLHSAQLSETEAQNMKSEMNSFRSSNNLAASLFDRLDVLYWRTQNAATYLWRLTGIRP